MCSDENVTEIYPFLKGRRNFIGGREFATVHGITDGQSTYPKLERFKDILKYLKAKKAKDGRTNELDRLIATFEGYVDNFYATSKSGVRRFTWEELPLVENLSAEDIYRECCDSTESIKGEFGVEALVSHLYQVGRKSILLRFANEYVEDVWEQSGGLFHLGPMDLYFFENPITHANPVEWEKRKKHFDHLISDERYPIQSRHSLKAKVMLCSGILLGAIKAANEAFVDPELVTKFSFRNSLDDERVKEEYRIVELYKAAILLDLLEEDRVK